MMINLNLLKFIALLFWTTISFVLVTTVSAQNDVSEFLRMEQEIERAVVRADLEYLKNIYAEDFRFAHGSGSVQNKNQWLASVAKGQFISRVVSHTQYH